MHRHPESTNLFVDKKDRFGWHDGQQIPHTTIQVSMLKDLVSLAQPASEYSFLSYLHETGRLYHYLNAQFDAVPRREFRNYMEWACRKNENIVFGQEVLSVEYSDVFHVHLPSAGVTADNIVIGVGIQPWVPSQALPHLGGRQFHVSDFLGKARDLGGLRVGIVGGGQSGAEAFFDLISRTGADLPRRVAWVSRRSSYFPLDDSPFTNDYYTPGYSDYFASLDMVTRKAFNARSVLTSDGISETTLRLIYQQVYTQHFINGNPGLAALYPNRQVTHVTPAAGGAWRLTLDHNDHPNAAESTELDVVIWATGFVPAPTDFLDPISSRLEREGDEFKIDSSFAVKWDGPEDRNVFIQNAARGQRGLADPNLSLNAWRSQRILDRLRGVRSEEHASSFINWAAQPAGDEIAEILWPSLRSPSWEPGSSAALRRARSPGATPAPRSRCSTGTRPGPAPAGGRPACTSCAAPARGRGACPATATPITRTWPASIRGRRSTRSAPPSWPAPRQSGATCRRRRRGEPARSPPRTCPFRPAWAPGTSPAATTVTWTGWSRLSRCGCGNGRTCWRGSPSPG
jgi:lysine N6-hydroxylase